MFERLQIVDSHTEGEPTRVVVSGFPELRGGTMAERREDFRERFDELRRGLILEPRGHEAIVGAVLTEPFDREFDAGVIFFNDAGYLGMCGHGIIGVAATLRFLGRAHGGQVRLETPVGPVSAKFEPGRRAITIQNVPSRTLGKRSVQIGPGQLLPEMIEGEVCYGGNWFLMVDVPDELLSHGPTAELLALTMRVRDALASQGVTGDGGEVIDHIELIAHGGPRAKNYVLCPGRAFDRSPCGTGTSAKLACLAAAGKLAPGEPYEIESITGGRFLGRYAIVNGEVVPYVTGRAFVTGRLEPVFDPEDPFRFGLTA